MKKTKKYGCFALSFLALVFGVVAETPAVKEGSPYAKWKNGPSPDPGFFPVAVWLQIPENADRYKAAGFNTYVGLWNGPTEKQLADLKKSGMRVFCEQNAVGLRHLDDPVIAGWMHGDEPDNAQELPGGKGYGPPIAPEKIVAEYEQIRAADPSRPVMLNLGQGVAWDGWFGRGVRSGHPEDYPLYLKGCDVVSFDIYPVVHESPAVAGKLWFVANGVDRLVGWSAGEKIVWNCIECTHIGDAEHKASPRQVRCEVWMSLVHGSHGLLYFVHQFKPVFREAALFDDAAMLDEVTALNRQIASLAPVLNSPSVSDSVTVKSQNADVPVDAMTKHYRDATYVFAVGMRDGGTTAVFTMPGPDSDQSVEVMGENRTVSMSGGVFKDEFAPWDVHVYRIGKKGKG